MRFRWWHIISGLRLGHTEDQTIHLGDVAGLDAAAAALEGRTVIADCAGVLVGFICQSGLRARLLVPPLVRHDHLEDLAATHHRSAGISHHAGSDRVGLSRQGLQFADRGLQVQRRINRVIDGGLGLLDYHFLPHRLFDVFLELLLQSGALRSQVNLELLAQRFYGALLDLRRFLEIFVHRGHLSRHFLHL